MAKDILLTEDNEVKTANGDLVVGDGDTQNLEHLLACNTGFIKDSPLTAMNLYRLTNARFMPQDVKRDVKVQLKADKWIKEIVLFENNVLTVDAVRSENY